MMDFKAPEGLICHILPDDPAVHREFKRRNHSEITQKPLRNHSETARHERNK